VSSSAGRDFSNAANPVPWAPRRDHMTASDGEQIFLYGGLIEVPLAGVAAALPPTKRAQAAATLTAENAPSADDDANFRPPPPRQPGTNLGGLQLAAVADVHRIFLSDPPTLLQQYPATTRRWYADFSNETYAPLRRYLHTHWPLSSPLPELNATAAEIALLAAHVGATTIFDVATLSRAAVETFRDPTQWNLPRVCTLKRRAQALVALCSVAFRPWDGWAEAQLAARASRARRRRSCRRPWTTSASPSRPWTRSRGTLRAAPCRPRARAAACT
jgi:hypothetical protein